MRTQTRILALLLAIVIVLPLAEDTHPAEAKKRFKTVTRSFSNSGAIANPAGGTTEGPSDPFPSTIDVDGFRKGKIKDVNLILHGFSHTRPEDIELMLVAGNGRNATVLSDVGGNNAAAGLTLTLDDEASSPLPANTQLVSGAFQPFDEGLGDGFPGSGITPSGNVALSTFDGGAPNGTWSLFGWDDSGGQIGSISGGWSLQIRAKVKKK
jgi:hypothetical protein